MVHGPAAGLAQLDALGDHLADDHRRHAVRAHLLERAGDRAGARAAFEAAAARATNPAQQRYLRARAQRLP